jgi:hypothetical protein
LQEVLEMVRSDVVFNVKGSFRENRHKIPPAQAPEVFALSLSPWSSMDKSGLYVQLKGFLLL